VKPGDAHQFFPAKELGKITTRQKQVKQLNRWHRNKAGYEKEIFYSENNHSLEQPPQGHGVDPITGGFQDASRHFAR